MPLTVKNCLNRWCLRASSSGRAIDFINVLRKKSGLDAVAPQMKGRPPLLSACIAPHCDHWESIDAETGRCLIRSLVKAKRHLVSSSARK